MLNTYIAQHQPFRVLALDKSTVDTRPYIAVEVAKTKRQMVGFELNIFGPKLIYKEAAKESLDRLSVLEVAYVPVGKTEIVAEGNWREVVDALPAGTLIFADEWTESKHYVGTIRFTKMPNGSWVEDRVDKANAA